MKIFTSSLAYTAPKQIYKIIKQFQLKIFTSSFFLSHDVTLSVNNSVLFFLTQAVKAVKTVMKVVFSLVGINTKML